jgi:predicted nucleotidyltransferase
VQQTGAPNDPQPNGQPSDRRRDDRLHGPFDGFRIGAIETPLRLYDLSEGGCFITSLHDQQTKVAFLLRIDLPYEGWITVKAETLYRRDNFGFAVRFLDVDEDASNRLERSLDQLRRRALHER